MRTSPAVRLLVLFVCAAAVLGTHPGAWWSWVPALLAIFAAGGLLICAGEYLNRGPR